VVKNLKQILKKVSGLNITLFAIASLVAVAPAVIPSVADAQLVNSFVNNCPADTGVRCSEGSIAAIFRLIINWALAIAFIAAVIMLIWGGFRYITSAGNDEQAKAGRGTIVNALIGIVIIVLSYIIVQIVYRFVAGQGTGGVLGP
jgi:Na+/melibiose symporter-like transporter